MERTFAMSQFIPAEMRADVIGGDGTIESYLADRCREEARRQGGEPIAEPSIEWHQIALGESVPAQDDGTVLVAVGDWRAVVTVKCRVEQQ